MKSSRWLLSSKAKKFIKHKLTRSRLFTFSNEFDADRNSVLHIQKDTIRMTDNAFSDNVCELEKLIFEKKNNP